LSLALVPSPGEQTLRIYNCVFEALSRLAVKSNFGSCVAPSVTWRRSGSVDFFFALIPCHQSGPVERKGGNLVIQADRADYIVSVAGQDLYMKSSRAPPVSR
jgi:hypothetical protein